MAVVAEAVEAEGLHQPVPGTGQHRHGPAFLERFVAWLAHGLVVDPAGRLDLDVQAGDGGPEEDGLAGLDDGRFAGGAVELVGRCAILAWGDVLYMR